MSVRTSKRTVLAAFSITVTLSNLAWAGEVTGTGTAKDGDDIMVQGIDFRLQGIDAFEESQACQDAKGVSVPCGQFAKEALSKLVQGKSVVCNPTGETDGKRVIGRCYAASANIEEQMVRSGWAFVRPDYAKERTATLCQLERSAAASQLGGWKFQFQRPYFMKRGHRKSLAQIACQHEFTR